MATVRMYRLRNRKTLTEYTILGEDKFEALRAKGWLQRFDTLEVTEVPDTRSVAKTKFKPTEADGMAEAAKSLLTTKRNQLPLNPQSDD